MTTTGGIAAAMQRLQSILQRHPAAGIAMDCAAVSSWQGAGRVATRHMHGTQVLTDLPESLGGAGAGVTPGWLLRAGLSACLASSIVVAAAVAGIELTELQVEATSRSDARGLFDMRDDAGRAISPGPFALALTVRIAAHRASTAQLHALVEDSRGRSPVFAALVQPVSIQMRIEAHAA